MKRFWITLLILVVISGMGFAGGAKDSSSATAVGEVPTIRIVGKDYSPTEDVNLQFLDKVAA